MIRLFVGHDPREAVAFDVFVHSVIARSSVPVAVIPLSLGMLRKRYQEKHVDGSNDFIYSRFLVPHLCGYEGWAIFADGDMLCLDDIANLWALRDSMKAVQVVKHDYKTKQKTKYLGAPNGDYPRKNWSSLVLWNCAHKSNRYLTPGRVTASSGAYLHRFQWLQDEEIGGLPAGWNWLVDEYDPDHWISLAHFTLGTPCFEGYGEGFHQGQWMAEFKAMLRTPEGLNWARRALE